MSIEMTESLISTISFENSLKFIFILLYKKLVENKIVKAIFSVELCDK